jgi:hypothetical protein
VRCFIQFCLGIQLIQLNLRYLINVAGATYSARLKSVLVHACLCLPLRSVDSSLFRYLLLCGSTLLNVDDPHVEFFQSQLQPWVHYVPVSRDFSDLNLRLQWLVEHQLEAQKIAEAGRDWALEHLQPHSLVRILVQKLPR